MNELEVFFDYTCPYCLRGHEYLVELLPLYPQIEVVWRPCEAHPRPERYGRHSDLCIQGMFFAMDQGVDLWTYHERMYRAAQKDRIDIEDIHVLADSVRDLLDADAFARSLETGEYARGQKAANQYAFGQSGVWAVPSYRMNGSKLDSIEDVGVTKKQLAAFMDLAKGLCEGE